MTEQEKEIPSFEMEVKLPRILHEPLKLENGTVLNEGDEVEHSKYGRGTIVRLAFYDDEPAGPVVYVEFANGEDHILGASFVRKLEG